MDINIILKNNVSVFVSQIFLFFESLLRILSEALVSAHYLVPLLTPLVKTNLV